MATQRIDVIRNYKADTTGWQKSLRSIDQSSSKAAQSMKRLDERMEKFQGSMSKIATLASKFGGALAGAFSVQAIGGAITTIAGKMDSLANSSQRIGIATETLQALRVEAQKVGASTEAVDTAMQRFSRRVAEAQQGTGALGKIFKEYGISLKSADGSQKSVNKLLGEYQQLLIRIQDPGERLRVSMAGLDSEGAKVAQTMINMGAPMEDVARFMKEQGRIVGDEIVTAYSEFATKSQELTDRLDVLQAKALTPVLEKLIRLLDVIDRLWSPISKFTAAVGDSYDNLMKMGGALGYLARVANSIINPLKTVMDTFDGLVDAALPDAPRMVIPVTLDADGIQEQARRGIAGIEKIAKSSPKLQANLSAMIEEGISKGFEISIISGFRSVERQAELWKDALKKYGSEAEARKWVAPPGASQHGKGAAADLKYANEAAKAWAHANAARYGLTFPLANEAWHIELEGARKATDAGAKSLKTYNEAQRRQQQIADEAARIQARVRQEWDQSKVAFDALRASLDPAIAAEQQLAAAAQTVATALAYQKVSTEEAQAVMQKATLQYDKNIASLKESAGSLADTVSTQLSSTFSSWIDSALSGTLNLSDAFKKLATDIAGAALKFALFGGNGGGGAGGLFGGILGSLFSANGNAFAGGISLPQGIYNRPTSFAFAGPPMGRFASGGVFGRRGLLGESGAEAVMPLKRLSNGKLGIEATGGGTEVIVNNYSGEGVSQRRRQLGDREIVEIAVGQVRDQIRRGGNATSRSFTEAFPGLRRGRL